MSTWILLAFFLAVWALWFIACVAEADLSDARRGVPEELRHGVSLFPGIPLFPMAAWGIAILIDRFVDPWGTYTIGGIHLVLGIVWGVSLYRNIRELRKLDVTR